MKERCQDSWEKSGCCGVCGFDNHLGCSLLMGRWSLHLSQRRGGGGRPMCLWKAAKLSRSLLLLALSNPESINQLFVACNIFGVKCKKRRRKEHLTPRRAGGKCLIKSATSEKCLDIAITATSIKSHSCASLDTFYKIIARRL